MSVHRHSSAAQRRKLKRAGRNGQYKLRQSWLLYSLNPGLGYGNDSRQNGPFGLRGSNSPLPEVISKIARAPPLVHDSAIYQQVRYQGEARFPNHSSADVIGSVTTSTFERSRWRGGRYACDTPDIMGCPSVLNRLSPLLANLIAVNLLQAKVDSNPIA